MPSKIQKNNIKNVRFTKQYIRVWKLLFLCSLHLLGISGFEGAKGKIVLFHLLLRNTDT